MLAVQSPPRAAQVLSAWSMRRWAVAVAATVAIAVLIGVPTAIIGNPYFTRMTAVLWWNYPVWILISVLAGLAFAACSGSSATSARGGAGVTTGCVLAAAAVGCPSCNSLVVAALGTSGAWSVWAPAQPAVAIIALALLARSLRRRLRAERSGPASAGTSQLGCHGS